MTSIKELMTLEEQRLELESSLSAVRVRINQLQISLVSSLGLWRKDTGLHFVRGDINEHDGGCGAPLNRMVRGQLRRRIISALEAVGPDGITVPDLARSLGMKPVNVHSWFHSARKRMPEIKKSAPGRYYLDGVPAFMRGSAQIARPGHRTARRSTRARRGETTRRILEVLAAESGNGIAVAEIAARIGTHCRNVHVWLSSTGKKNPLIVRSGRGVYQMLKAAPTTSNG